jgi:hypothetical protein
MKFFQVVPLYALKMDNRRETVYDLTPPAKWQIVAIWAICWFMGVSELGVLIKKMAFNRVYNGFQNTIRVFRVAFFVGKVAFNPL